VRSVLTLVAVSRVQVVVALFAEQVVLFVVIADGTDEVQSGRQVIAAPGRQSLIECSKALFVGRLTTDQQIVATAAFQLVLTGAANQNIIAAATLDVVVSTSGKDELRNGGVAASIAASVRTAVVLIIAVAEIRHDAVDGRDLKRLLDAVAATITAAVAAAIRTACLVQFDVNLQFILLFVELQVYVVATRSTDDEQRAVDDTNSLNHSGCRR